MKLPPRGCLRFLSLVFTVSACSAKVPPGEPPVTGIQTASARDEQLLALARNDEQVLQGKASYAIYCIACHGAEGITVDSPSNLFDRKWRHYDTPSGIEKMIREGFLDKGMPPWGEMIPGTEIEAMVAYLLSFQKPTDSKNG